MRLTKNLVLIGLPGSGKSTLGRFISKDTGVPFIDTDELIESTAGKSIEQIFRTEGEAAFREMEKRMVAKVSQLRGVIISTGGGAWIHRGNRDSLRENGVTVYLDARLNELWTRLKNDSVKRPLLKSGFGALEKLYLDRHGVYLTADRVIDTTGKTTADLYSEIHTALDIREDRPAFDYSPNRIDIHTSQKSYPIYVNPGLISSVGEYMTSRFEGDMENSRKVFIVTTPLVKSICLKEVAAPLTGSGFYYEIFTLPDGEEAKDLKWCDRAYSKLATAGYSRDDVVVTLGGGVTGDVGGFIAATYMRGMRLVHIPTTLIAQVDSSIGGKTAVNLPEGKNLVGCFYQPEMVLADPFLLDYLSDYQFRQGLAECIKYGIIEGVDRFEYLEKSIMPLRSRNIEALYQLVADCCRIKGSIVERDETDRGLRMKLNLGHTVGHALEAAAGYGRLGHGDAVALGIIAEAHISKSIGMLGKEEFARIEKLINDAGLEPMAGFSIPKVLSCLNADKKMTGGKNRFALPAGIGAVEITDGIDVDTIEEALRYIGGEWESK